MAPGPQVCSDGGSWESVPRAGRERMAMTQVQSWWVTHQPPTGGWGGWPFAGEFLCISRRVAWGQESWSLLEGKLEGG